MDIFNKKGKLIIPEPERLHFLGHEKGVLTKEKRVLVKQLYCPNRHLLITPDNPKFDGEPGIHLICEGNTIWQSVYLSPFQGDRRKQFKTEFQHGEILKISCPICHTFFPNYAPHNCNPDAMYIAIFLDQGSSLDNTACICNAWECYASFLRLAGEILSEVRIYSHPF